MVVEAVMDAVEVSVPTSVTVYVPVAAVGVLEFDGVVDDPEFAPPHETAKHTSARKKIPQNVRRQRPRHPIRQKSSSPANVAQICVVLSSASTGRQLL